MSCALTLYVDNSNVVELQGLTNSASGDFDVGATVTVTLYDRDGVAVTGQVWPATMAYVTGTDATYRATLESDIDIVAGRVYRAVVSATGSGGETGKWTGSVIAETRSCT